MSNNEVNRSRLLWAGFMAILAAGIGFGVRGGILANWGASYGFTAAQLGDITSGGLQGFCFGIFIGGLIVDKIGYGKLVLAAFAFHVVSALITFGATGGQPMETTFQFLYWGTFLFAVANGVLEAVSNPLVATLYPENRTHYLNILHASWPAGLVLGGVIGWTMGAMDWKIQLGLFLIPTLIYGFMFLGQKMPKSEASEKGLSLGEMFKDIGLGGGLVACLLVLLFIKGPLGAMLQLLTGEDFFAGTGFLWVSILVAGGLWAMIGVITKGSIGHWLIFILFIAHALVGSVELGTDSWIQNITGNILTPDQGKILFVFTSAIMFALRFCAEFIESRLKISPIGLLLICSILAVIGLNMAAGITTLAGAFVALAVYAVGKTFFWPTMLAVVGDRFPSSGAVAMSIMGGIGMMSAGVLGGPGLGYAKDRFASAELESQNAAVYQEYKADSVSKFPIPGFKAVNGIDGAKLGGIQEKLNSGEALSANEKQVHEASIIGDRKTLRADSMIPVAMSVIYIFLILYFKGIGGYKQLTIEEEKALNG
jgi:MFS family permease